MSLLDEIAVVAVRLANLKKEQQRLQQEQAANSKEARELTFKLGEISDKYIQSDEYQNTIPASSDLPSPEPSAD